jgi:hypothetical protein
MTPVQQTPQLFTLALLLCVVVSFVVFLIVAFRLIRGWRSGALRLLSRWGIGASVYLTISVAVSLLRPARIIELGQDWCFDDWCIAVEAVRHAPAPNGTDVVYTTDIRIDNDARSPEAVRGFWVYVRDADDRRFGPTPGTWQEVVATPVPPHGSARTLLDFVVPQGVRPTGFVTGHGGGAGGILPSLLEIGQGGWLFHEPNMIRLQ